jgi:hypothetical protein
VLEWQSHVPGQNQRQLTPQVCDQQEGLCAVLLENTFDYGQHKDLADQMRTTWEKIVHHVGTIHGREQRIAE